MIGIQNSKSNKIKKLKLRGVFLCLPINILLAEHVIKK